MLRFAVSQSSWVGCCKAVVWVGHCESVTVGWLLWVSRCGFLSLRRLLRELLCVARCAGRLLWFGRYGLLAVVCSVAVMVVAVVWFPGSVTHFQSVGIERVGSGSGGEACSIFYLEVTGEAVLWWRNFETREPA